MTFGYLWHLISNVPQSLGESHVRDLPTLTLTSSVQAMKSEWKVRVQWPNLLCDKKGLQKYQCNSFRSHFAVCIKSMLLDYSDPQSSVKEKIHHMNPGGRTWLVLVSQSIWYFQSCKDLKMQKSLLITLFDPRSLSGMLNQKLTVTHPNVLLELRHIA